MPVLSLRSIHPFIAVLETLHWWHHKELSQVKDKSSTQHTSSDWCVGCKWPPNTPVGASGHFDETPHNASIQPGGWKQAIRHKPESRGWKIVFSVVFSAAEDKIEYLKISLGLRAWGFPMTLVYQRQTSEFKQSTLHWPGSNLNRYHTSILLRSVFMCLIGLQTGTLDTLAESKIKTQYLINFKQESFTDVTGKMKYLTQAADNMLLFWKLWGSVKAHLHELRPICTLEQQNNCVQLASPVHFTVYWHMPLVASWRTHCP